VPPCHRGQRAPVKAQGTWHATTDPAEVCWLGVHGLAPTASKLKWLETSLETFIPYVYHTKSQFDFRPTTSLLFSANQGRFEESVAASTWVAPSAQRRQFGFGNLLTVGRPLCPRPADPGPRCSSRSRRPRFRPKRRAGRRPEGPKPPSLARNHRVLRVSRIGLGVDGAPMGSRWRLIRRYMYDAWLLAQAASVSRAARVGERRNLRWKTEKKPYGLRSMWTSHRCSLIGGWSAVRLLLGRSHFLLKVLLHVLPLERLESRRGTAAPDPGRN
jgi:hypothetical protein